MDKAEKTMEKIISLAKTRGFVYPAASAKKRRQAAASAQKKDGRTAEQVIPQQRNFPAILCFCKKRIYFIRIPDIVQGGIFLQSSRDVLSSALPQSPVSYASSCDTVFQLGQIFQHAGRSPITFFRCDGQSLSQDVPEHGEGALGAAREKSGILVGDGDQIIPYRLQRR